MNWVLVLEFVRKNKKGGFIISHIPLHQLNQQIIHVVQLISLVWFVIFEV